jgi:hypothetical protein
MTKRTICVATGSRAEYGYLRPVMKKIQESTNLRLKVVLAGMHLQSEYGRTAVALLGPPLLGCPMQASGATRPSIEQGDLFDLKMGHFR